MECCAALLRALRRDARRSERRRRGRLAIERAIDANPLVEVRQLYQHQKRSALSLRVIFVRVRRSRRAPLLRRLTREGVHPGDHHRPFLLASLFLLAQLRCDEAGGRYLAASTALRRGDDVLVARPLATALHDSCASGHCHACLRTVMGSLEGKEADPGTDGGGEHQARIASCRRCDAAVYCDAACRADDAPAHALECALLAGDGGREKAPRGERRRRRTNTLRGSGRTPSWGPKRKDDVEDHRGDDGNDDASIVVAAREPWSTRLLARALADPGASASFDETLRRDVLWALESRPNPSLLAGAEGTDALDRLARAATNLRGGRAASAGNRTRAGVCVNHVASLRHAHGAVVNNAVEVVRLPPRLVAGPSSGATSAPRDGRSEGDPGGGGGGARGGSSGASSSSPLAPRAVAAALYVEPSMINHSCRPNCAWSFGGGAELRLRVVADDVRPGDALTVCYVHPLVACQPVRARRARIAKQFGFDCRCRACDAEEAGHDGDRRASDGVSTPRVDEALADLRSFLGAARRLPPESPPDVSDDVAAGILFDGLSCRWRAVTSARAASELSSEAGAVEGEVIAPLDAAWDAMNAFERLGRRRRDLASDDNSDEWARLRTRPEALRCAVAAAGGVRVETERCGVGHAPDVLRARRLEVEWLTLALGQKGGEDAAGRDRLAAVARGLEAHLRLLS